MSARQFPNAQRPAGGGAPEPAGVPGPLLLYDGVCALCNGAVRFILKWDRHGTVRFAPLQGRTAAAALARHPHLGGVDSMVWVQPAAVAEHGRVRPERALTRSDAAVAIGRYLGGVWGLLAILVQLVPRPLRNRAYDLVARARYRVFGRYDVCPVPPPAHRARFMD